MNKQNIGLSSSKIDYFGSFFTPKIIIIIIKRRDYSGSSRRSNSEEQECWSGISQNCKVIGPMDSW